MKDKVKEEKFNKIEIQTYKYKKLMCFDCKYNVEEKCTLKRAVRQCARKGLKNRA